MTIRVANDVSPALEAEIFAVPQGHTRRIIGDAEAGDTSTIQLKPTVTRGRRLQLVAVMSGRRIESQPFSVKGKTRVFWDLKKNEVTTK